MSYFFFSYKITKVKIKTNHTFIILQLVEYKREYKKGDRLDLFLTYD